MYIFNELRLFVYILHRRCKLIGQVNICFMLLLWLEFCC